jgi:predicted amidohydrolase
MSKMISLGIYQDYPIFGDIEGNLGRFSAIMTIKKADLVVCSELFTTGYQFKSKEELAGLAEEIPGGFTTEALCEIADVQYRYIVAGVAEREGDNFYNTAVAVGPDGFIGKYRKLHLFNDEKKIFTPGDSEAPVFKFGDINVGIMVCFDWIFPEVARSLALIGAEIICHPSNLVMQMCPAAMVTRSIENRVYTVTVNRIGCEERIEGQKLCFTGQSQIVAPDGTFRSRLPEDLESFDIVEIDPAMANDKNVTPNNHVINDRRPKLYKGLLSE